MAELKYDPVPQDHKAFCQVSCDHFLIRSWPLMRARELMRGVIESFKQE